MALTKVLNMLMEEEDFEQLKVRVARINLDNPKRKTVTISEYIRQLIKDHLNEQQPQV